MQSVKYWNNQEVNGVIYTESEENRYVKFEPIQMNKNWRGIFATRT